MNLNISNLQSMLDDIERETNYTSLLTGRNRLSERVMKAMASVPRDQFVPGHLQAQAYIDGPLPIGSGQTISQPFIVALMTDLLSTDQNSSILEIGTGSGYQTAILAQLVKRVFTVEIIRSLSLEAQSRFRAMNYANIKTLVGNGYHGWPSNAPFDGIIVTAAAPEIPEDLVKQLKSGGRMVIPVGMPYSRQELIILEKLADGTKRQQKILDVAFVPLVDAQH
jgi:protein-L-isoaspartate(D-aspartate) O-methyltransferase